MSSIRFARWSFVLGSPFVLALATWCAAQGTKPLSGAKPSGDKETAPVVAPGKNAKPGQDTRGMVVKEGPSNPKTECKYENQWAVIVGINYEATQREGLNRGRMTPLKRAEADAQKLAELLRKHFGYRDDHIVLLSGKQATKEAIEKQLQNAFLGDKTKVTPKDSVLFFFSGHGYLRQSPGTSKGQGYLLPFDVRKLDSGEPDLATCIDVSSLLVENLKDHCPARHKLLILDCCHSGAVFRVKAGQLSERSEFERKDADLFNMAAFQAITASREGQLASDGDRLADNSPLTSALARSLKKLGAGGKPFTVNELFRTMSYHLAGVLPAFQSPECRWIDDDRGEFHFLPQPGVKFDEEPLSPEAEKLLLAMIPSTFGNWWGEEIVWFMPGLRMDILDKLPKTRAPGLDFDKDTLRQTALKLAEEKATGAPAEVAHRYRHLRQLVDRKQLSDQDHEIDEIIEELSDVVTKNKSPGWVCDLHYLAVLKHRRGRFAEAKESYQQALQEYARQSALNATTRPLHALCLVDYGTLLLNNLREYEEACVAFAKSREALGEIPPKPFSFYTLCREADGYRHIKMWGLSEDALQQARHLMMEWDPNETHLLSAATWKHVAWAHMEQCQFKEAIQGFERSKRILDQVRAANANQHESIIDLLHVEHGLALAERFQGHDEQALKRYRQLSARIAEEIRKLDQSTAHVAGYSDIRRLLSARYVNTLERQADCMLFGRVQDLAEAADDYRRALRSSRVVLPDAKIDLMYRRAIALAMPSAAQDIELAAHLCQEAGALEADLKKLDMGKELSGKIRLVQAIAQALIGCGPAASSDSKPAKSPATTTPVTTTPATTTPAATTPAAGKVAAGLRDLLRQLQKDSDATFDRDEMERLMFAHRLLLQHRDRFDLDRFETANHADQLLRLCRQALRHAGAPGEMDLDFLQYLRLYYDTAFDAKVALAPKHAKELIEIAWEATQGSSYRKSEDVTPVLVLYQSSGQFHFLLDVPATRSRPGASSFFALRKEWNDERLIREACQKGPLLPLPEEVRQALSRLGEGEKVVLQWRDPVLSFGLQSRSPASYATYYPPPAVSSSDGPPSVPLRTTAKPPEGEFRFPFDVQSLSRRLNLWEPGSEERTFRQAQETGSTFRQRDELPPVAKPGLEHAP